MNFNLHLGDSWSAELLDEVTLEAQSFLTAFANDEAFSTNITLAFGNLIGTEILEGLRQQWSLGNFDELPEIEIRSGSEINGANGAFTSATNTIYLSREFIFQNASNPGVITNVLLEEIGHFVDAWINSLDAAGDEGAIFSALVRGESLSNEQLAFLQAEDDTFTLADGTQIEASNLIVDTLVDENDGNFSAGDLSLREVIALATPGDTITFANSGTISLTLGELNINKALTINGDIDGNGTPDITVSGNNASRVFNINDNDGQNTISVKISSLEITNGSSSEGSGIYINLSEELVLTNSTLRNNRAKSSGGAIFTFTADPIFRPDRTLFDIEGKVSISNSTLTGNYASYRGGAIYTQRRSRTFISNSTLSYNQAGPLTSGSFDNNGGAIYNDATSTLSIDSSTVFGNSAMSGAGIQNFGTATLTNSIVGGSSGGGKDFSGYAPTLSGKNLIADGSIASTDTNGVINGDPRVGPLQDNGGTTFTHQLLIGSPAIDKGDNAGAQDTEDQRGKERRDATNQFWGGKIDLGAFEVTPLDQLVNLTVQNSSNDNYGYAYEAVGGLGQQARFTIARNTRAGDLDVTIKISGDAIFAQDYQFIDAIYDPGYQFIDNNQPPIAVSGDQLKIRIPNGSYKTSVAFKALDDVFVEGPESIVLELAENSTNEIAYKAETGKDRIVLSIRTLARIV